MHVLIDEYFVPPTLALPVSSTCKRTIRSRPLARAMYPEIRLEGDNLIRFPVSHVYFFIVGEKSIAKVVGGAMAGFESLD